MPVTVYRTIILYVAVMISVRLMGKRQLGDMQPGELVVTILLSEIAAMPLQDTDLPIFSGLASVVTLISLELLLSVLSLKSIFVRKLISGRSVVLIKEGVVDEKALKSVRLTALDLIEMLRAQQIFSLDDIAFAVLETGGDLSVMLKSAKQPATAEQVGIKPEKALLPLPVVSDGHILEDSLATLGISRQTLKKELKAQRLSAKEVLLATRDSSGSLTVVKKEKNR